MDSLQIQFSMQSEHWARHLEMSRCIEQLSYQEEYYLEEIPQGNHNNILQELYASIISSSVFRSSPRNCNSSVYYTKYSRETPNFLI